MQTSPNSSTRSAVADRAIADPAFAPRPRAVSALQSRLTNVARALKGRLVRLRLAIEIFADHLRDAVNFARWSHDGRTDRDPARIEHSIAKMYHGIEKGLALPMPKPGFGQDKIRQLIRKLDRWHQEQPPTALTLGAIAALRSYSAFNRRAGLPPWALLDDWLDRQPLQPTVQGGTLRRKAVEIARITATTGPEFFNSRHSLRQFGPGKIPDHDIETAVRIAIKSPSACNRQGIRVYCFSPAETALQWQPGNAGFGHTADQAFVVTADLTAFSTAGERHQAHTDGGIFAMSLAYALHALGYGSCMLAWNRRPKAERAMRAALQIPDREVIVLMMAAGTLPEEFSVACSQRRELHEVLRRPDIHAGCNTMTPRV